MMISLFFLVCLSLGISSTVKGVYAEQRFIQPTTPTLPSTHCQSETPCYTLNELIIRASIGGEQQREVFSSFQNVIFLSGNHLINVSNKFLSVAEAESLTLQGEGEVTITCRDDFSFLFIDVYKVTFKSLKFINCKAFAQYLKTVLPEHFNYTFIFWGSGSSHVDFNKVEIVSENATGVVLLDVSHFKFLKSNFSTGGIGIYSRHVTALYILGCLFRDSSFKIYGSSTDSVNIEFTTFQQATVWPVISCSAFRLLELKNIKMISNPAQFLMNIEDCKVTLKGRNFFSSNSGALVVGVGGTLDIEKAIVQFVNNTIQSAFGLPGVPLCIAGGTVIFDSSFVTFQNNSGEDCGGIIAHRSTIECINARIDFIANKGVDGGAMALYKESSLLFLLREEGALINFINNVADRQGGGLFIDDSGYTTDFHRNLSHSFIGPVPDINATFQFINNSARFSGNQIHGGWIDWWISISKPLSFNKNAIRTFHFEPDGPLAVSSGPIRVCMCTNLVTNCSITEFQTEVFPGQTIYLEVVAVGQRYGTTISFIVASTDEKGESVANPEVIPEAEYFQNVQRTCTTVHYTIMSPKNEERLHLRPFQRNRLNIEQNLLKQHPFHENLFKEFLIKATLMKCPLGFAFSHIIYSCICLKSLELHGLSCNTKSFEIIRTEQKWVTAVFNHTMPDEYPGVIIHNQCPYNYCRKDADSLSIRLELYEEQCANNRSGMLCGKCQANLSQILGSSHCRRCSNLMLLAIVPIVIVLGPLLVAFLMILNLTVSAGTINGLIFYANVIRAQHTMFFTPEISNSFLDKFIAWLNLDLGIESCLYDGLDAFTKTWLQFLFPIYIWILVIIIIISSHYSTRVSRISGNNAVQVLATLFLLSYTKLLRIIITVFSSTVIVYPDKFTKWVWLYDGNVEFL